MKDDLDKISDVLVDFFKVSRISKTIATFHDLNISGWEKWWQMELAIFLADHKSIGEWDIEHPFDTDKRTLLNQDRMALDIGFRLKSHKKDEWYFVELKQSPKYKDCIDRMVGDASKVFSARKKSFDGLAIRYIACAGIFLNDDEEKIMDYAEAGLKKYQIEIEDGFVVEKIDKHHMLLIF